MAGRTHGVHAEPTTFGAKLALWCLQVDRDRTRLRQAREGDRGRQAVGCSRHVLEHRSRSRGVGLRGARPAAGAGDAGDQSRSPRRSTCTRARRSARRRDDRDRGAPPPAHRGRRGRGGVQGRAEGLVGDAPQAQPDHGRATVGSRPHPARQPLRRARRREPLARARHLALVGRAGDPSRLLAARVLRAAQGGVARRQPPGRRRTGCARTSTSRSGSCSASPCCSRWSRRASRATTRIASCRKTPRWRVPRASRSVRCSKATCGSTLDADALDEAFGLERALRNIGGVFDAMDRVE